MYACPYVHSYVRMSVCFRCCVDQPNKLLQYVQGYQYIPVYLYLYMVCIIYCTVLYEFTIPPLAYCATAEEELTSK